MLEKIDIHVIDHCNLNCRSCTHFSPLAEPFFLDIDEFERDLTRFSQLSGAELGSLFLLGGEPLLHNELIDFFPIARKLLPNTRIIIITNGILLPKQEDRFWKACRRYNIQIWISIYDVINYDEIKKKADKFNVKLLYTSFRKNDDGSKVWWKFKLDPDGNNHWVESFEKCGNKNCVTLKHGKLYTCCTIAHIEHFNKYFNANLQVSEFDYIDIYKVNSYQAILDVMVKPAPFCRYCTGQVETGLWSVSKKDINEWI